MDSSFKTFAKHALRVSTSYAAVLIVFVILSYPIIGLAGENPAPTVRVVSFLLFIFLFFLLYRDMHELATKERRPQYEIFPRPSRGLLLGLAGLIPIWLLQVIFLVIPMYNLETLQRRLIQAISVPFFWIVSSFGGANYAYPLLLPIVALIALLGYWAGLRDFLLLKTIYKFVGYTPKIRVRKPRKKRTGRGFWGM